jgi:hypothetical protein
MNKKVLLVFFLVPLFVFAQQDSKSGKKKVVKPEAKETEVLEETKPDLSKESLFKGLFSAGLNMTQVDGDQEFGYKKFGANVGVGTLVKFSKLFSASVEIVYSMQGARPRYSSFDSGKKDKFDITWDYIQIPLSVNIHDKRVVMFGAGLSFGALMRSSQTNSDGRDTLTPAGQLPRKFDVSAQVGATFFLLKNQLGIGARFSYSLLKVRDAVAGSKAKGQFNNVISLRVVYILDPKRYKKH